VVEAKFCFGYRAAFRLFNSPVIIRCMIETLKPPTDSLYKFLAIIGLIFFLTSVISPFVLRREFHRQYAEFLRDERINNLDAETWQETSKQMQKQSIELDESSKRLDETFDPKSNRSLAEQGRVLKEAKKIEEKQFATIELLDKQMRDWRKQDAQVEYKRNLLEEYEDYAKNLFTLCLLGGPVGLFMSVFGFVLWYRRAQKYEDLVLKKKVEQPTESRIIIP